MKGHLNAGGNASTDGVDEARKRAASAILSYSLCGGPMANDPASCRIPTCPS
jgi:hypothetical protein